MISTFFLSSYILFVVLSFNSSAAATPIVHWLAYTTAWPLL